MVAVSEFVKYIHPDINQVETTLLTQRLNTVLTDFCQQSKILQVTMEPLTLIPQVREIEIETPTDTTLVEIRRLVYKGKTELLSQTIDWLDRDDPFWRTKDGEPTHYTHVGRNTIMVTPHPTTTEVMGITGRIAVKPTRTATTVDDILFDDWAEVIAAGTKAHLMAMPRKPWTNPNLAQGFAMAYAEGIEQASAQAQNSYSARIRRRTKAYF